MDKESTMESMLLRLPNVDVLYKSLFSRIHPKELWICRRVCREFQRLCDEYFRSYCIVLDFRSHELTIGGLKVLMSACRSVRKFYWHSKLTYNVPMDLTSYKTYFWGGKQLNTLDLHNINLNVSRNSYIGNYCKELSTLKVTNCEISCDQLLVELAGTATKLKELDLSKTVLSNLSTAFSEFISNKRELVVLKLAYCKISELDMQRASKSCPLLKEVDLRYTSASDVTVQYIMEYCTHVSLLLLSGCPLADVQIIQQLNKRNISSDVAQTATEVDKPSVYIQP